MPIRSDTLDSFDDPDWSGNVIDPPPRPKHPPLPPLTSLLLPGPDLKVSLDNDHHNHVHWAIDGRLTPRCGLFQRLRNRVALWIGGRGVVQSSDCY